ncbi:centrosomal protein 20 [Hydra vulgaris]|uniref:Centrosomal protein 20 n=1 Tax=Hydra vulgaris TaxID=6087 RepID=A0ABM4CP41_HYDVU
MASLEDLKNVLKDTLNHRGVLNQIRARIRAEVFSALDDKTVPPPVLSNENLLINELIREYLEFNKYKYTEAVLLSESGQPKEPIDREFLANELHIREDSTSSKLPILYGLISSFLQQKQYKDELPVQDVPQKQPNYLKSSLKKKSNEFSECSEENSLIHGKGLIFHSKK